ncbi:hypothetical protein CEXT_37341 [Caerostris extrusa]|uniref:Uncharacterized protein n=1 Tax=Caerostris extrusa TaxID=172846 RepID=A0AAV4RWR8_CAEEX|nr:hypothetical protein CEXT_37341 [Caerostris extrusa]
MYQLYKQNVHSDVEGFIPLIMSTISLQPTLHQRNSPNFNREVFVDFMAAQIKTLSFLAYIVRLYQNSVNDHSSELARGMVGLLRLCPQEVAHLRKELLIAARHILATELREKFVGCLEELFDESVLIGTGWTAYESLRPLAFSTLADLVHHVRAHLPLRVLSLAVNVFSKNVHDESLVTTIQTMSCKLLLNLVECIRQRSDRENGNRQQQFTSSNPQLGNQQALGTPQVLSSMQNAAAAHNSGILQRPTAAPLFAANAGSGSAEVKGRSER